MKLIVGLGNPGEKYKNTRHNIGFCVLDLLLNNLGVEINKKKFNSLYLRTNDAIFLKPQTFMNLSGDAVDLVMNFFKISINDILIIYDDMDMKIGKIIIKKTGNAGGHNGMKNIINKLGSNKINRVKIGIGRGLDARKYVLSNFSTYQQNIINESKLLAVKAIEIFIKQDISKAINFLNRTGKED